MLRLRHWGLFLGFVSLLAYGSARAAEDSGQALLDKATDIKLSAERVADLNEVIKLCQDAIAAGLDAGSKKFADELLASTLTQRASLICLELFERPVSQIRVQKLVPMALADLEETLKLDSEQAEAQYLIGRLYAHMGEREKGLQALDAAVRLTEGEPAARAKSLMIRANLKTDPAARLADFDETVKLLPHDANALRLRGMFHFSQNEFAPALADFDAAIALDPNDADTYEARGLVQSVDQKYDDAMGSFNKAIELAPESPMAYIYRSKVRAMRGDNPAALADVEQALKLAPGSVQARLLHAALLGTSGKFDKALVDLNLLRTAMPDNPEVLLQIAMVHQASKQPRQAVEVYDAVLHADPGNLAAYRGRADARLSLGQQSEAVADYDSALQLEPKNSGVLNNLAWVLATSPEDQLRNGKRAIELATLACEVTEFKQAHILSTLAAGYAEVGDFETACKWSKKAVELGTDGLKSQLRKELESYQAGHPWREATPPTEDDAADQTASPLPTPAPESDDTARTKSER
ncbi:MAG TPA: tetratricopeptide repeat protein [Pirellulales bacterium]|nr:tetratricopeptide repeat protein [Pirellulales bacterium]